jgi:hypothetical protein
MDNIFVMEFHRPCPMGCEDIEIRIGKAKNIEDAYEKAYLHRNKYLKDWLFYVGDIVWEADNTAFVHGYFKGDEK